MFTLYTLSPHWNVNSFLLMECCSWRMLATRILGFMGPCWGGGLASLTKVLASYNVWLMWFYFFDFFIFFLLFMGFLILYFSYFFYFHFFFAGWGSRQSIRSVSLTKGSNMGIICAGIIEI